VKNEKSSHQDKEKSIQKKGKGIVRKKE